MVHFQDSWLKLIYLLCPYEAALINSICWGKFDQQKQKQNFIFTKHHPYKLPMIIFSISPHYCEVGGNISFGIFIFTGKIL